MKFHHTIIPTVLSIVLTVFAEQADASRGVFAFSCFVTGWCMALSYAALKLEEALEQ